MRLMLGGLALATMVSTGCQGGVSDGANNADLVTRTIVAMGANGKASVRTVQLTQVQQARDVAKLFRDHGDDDLAAQFDAKADALAAARGPQTVGVTEQALTQDTGCGTSSIHIYSGTGYSGSYELCFTGGPGDTVYISNYIGSWGYGILSAINYTSNQYIRIDEYVPGWWDQICRTVGADSAWDGTGAGTCDQYATELVWLLP